MNEILKKLSESIKIVESGGGIVSIHADSLSSQSTIHMEVYKFIEIFPEHKKSRFDSQFDKLLVNEGNVEIFCLVSHTE